MVKAGEVELDSPMDAVELMMERMGVSEDGIIKGYEFWDKSLSGKQEIKKES
jgi:hypothetical protein